MKWRDAYPPGEGAVHAGQASYARRAQEVCSTANVSLITERRITPISQGVRMYVRMLS